MPLVTINMVAGRDRSVVQECLREVAETVSRTLDAPLSSVRVLANEVASELWTVGTTLKSEERPRSYLVNPTQRAMEAAQRDVSPPPIPARPPIPCSKRPGERWPKLVRL